MLRFGLTVLRLGMECVLYGLTVLRFGMECVLSLSHCVKVGHGVCIVTLTVLWSMHHMRTVKASSCYPFHKWQKSGKHNLTLHHILMTQQHTARAVSSFLAETKERKEEKNFLIPKTSCHHHFPPAIAVASYPEFEEEQ